MINDPQLSHIPTSSYATDILDAMHEISFF